MSLLKLLKNTWQNIWVINFFVPVQKYLKYKNVLLFFLIQYEYLSCNELQQWRIVMAWLYISKTFRSRLTHRLYKYRAKLTRDFGRKDPPEEYPSLDPCNPELGNWKTNDNVFDLNIKRVILFSIVRSDDINVQCTQEFHYVQSTCAIVKDEKSNIYNIGWRDDDTDIIIKYRKCDRNVQWNINSQMLTHIIYTVFAYYILYARIQMIVCVYIYIHVEIYRTEYGERRKWDIDFPARPDTPLSHRSLPSATLPLG